jgi:hypothetical protein
MHFYLQFFRVGACVACILNKIAHGSALTNQKMSTRSILTNFRSAVLAVGATLVFSGAAFADTVAIPVSWLIGVESEFPTPVPALGVLGTTFTGYTTSFPYALGTFSVGTTGSYTVSLSTPGFNNFIYLLTGTFAPSGATPTTPVANFFAGEVNVNTTTYSTTLQAGVQYSYVLFFTQAAPSGSATFTITGPGCIGLGGSNCLVAAPTLGPGPLALLAILVAVSGMFFLRRRLGTIA